MGVTCSAGICQKEFTGKPALALLDEEIQIEHLIVRLDEIVQNGSAGAAAVEDFSESARSSAASASFHLGAARPIQKRGLSRRNKLGHVVPMRNKRPPHEGASETERRESRKQHHCGVLNQPASAKAYTSSSPAPSSKLQFSRNNASGDGAFDHSISPMFLNLVEGSTRACRNTTCMKTFPGCSQFKKDFLAEIFRQLTWC